MIMLLVGLALALAGQGVSASANQTPAYPNPLSVGPSLCPLVPACHCKWSNGKQGATCEKRQLTQIPDQLPQETQHLDMTGNSLIQLSQHIFQDKHLKNLQKIFLSECKLSHIADDAFAHLSNLIELDLSHNNIQHVPIKSFEQLNHSLRKLILAFNPIEVIESDTFVSLSQLNLLDLNNCQINQLKPNAFNGLTKLTELKLQDNKLTQLPMNVVVNLRKFTNIDLFNNPWHCDCELRQSIDWMTQNNIQQTMIPTCSSPIKHKDIRWHNVRAEDYLCPPVVLNKVTETVVGAGSNVSLSCVTRGSPPFSFVWFQDEKNMTPLANVTDSPVTTKLLEEHRYEIGEEQASYGQTNVSTSTLYLYNLQISDTSLFLCLVENPAGIAFANFTLVVDDSPPAQLENNIGGITSQNGNTNSFFQSLGLSQGEVQLGIVSIGFVIILVAAIVLLLVFKHSSRSSKSSSHSNEYKKSQISDPHQLTLDSSNKFASSAHNKLNQKRSIMTDSEDNEDSDDNSSSGSSVNKNVPKSLAVNHLDGFIEYMKSGIINMDYHSMSPVIQFNNHTLKNQPASHFPSASNASSVPYYAGGGNGSASMATTTSDLSPASSGSGSGNMTTNFVTNDAPTTITNCDHLQQQYLQQHHHLHHHQMSDMAPPTNTTTTSYTSDYQSGYGGDDLSTMPHAYYESGQQEVMNQHQYHHHQPSGPYNGQIMVTPMPGSLRPTSVLMAHSQQQAADHQLMMRDMHGRLVPNQQRLRMNSEFQIL